MQLGKRTGGRERDSGCHSDELEEACWFPTGTGHQTGRRVRGVLTRYRETWELSLKPPFGPFQNGMGLVLEAALHM